MNLRLDESLATNYKNSTQKIRVMSEVWLLNETVSETFEIEANSEEEAVSVAIQEYNAGNFVVSADNVEYRQISVVDENGEFTDWITF